jgi:hypothetical protein
VPRAPLGAAVAIGACLVAAGCGGGEGGRIQRAENVQRCLSQKKLPTDLTRDARMPGSDEPADLLVTELLSPSAARLYVFATVDAAETAQGTAQQKLDRRDNVVIVFAEGPTAADRKVLDECLSGRI